MKGSFALAVVALSLSAPLAVAQQDERIEIVKMTDRIYRITATSGYQVNLVASVGQDGILLVDTGFKDTAEELHKKLAGFNVGDVRLVINTHAHRDHNGGNWAFGKDAIVISHELMRDKITRGAYVLEEHPAWALPEVMLSDRLTLFFNGERIEVMALPGSHDSDDLIVHFSDSKIVYMGDIGYGMNYPSYDSTSGDATKYAEVVRRALDRLPEDVLFVSGHGDDCVREQMEEYQQMLDETTKLVLAEVAKGRSADEIDVGVLGRWGSYAGKYVSAEEWIRTLVESASKEVWGKASPIEPMYREYRNGGVNAAVKAFQEIRERQPGDYSYDLYRFGDFLIAEKAYDDAIVMFGVLIATHGDSPYLWYFHRKRGDAYEGAGNRSEAISDYRRSLDLKPDNEVTKQKLEELGAA